MQLKMAEVKQAGKHVNNNVRPSSELHHSESDLSDTLDHDLPIAAADSDVAAAVIDSNADASANSSNASSTTGNRRVKLYQLNDAGEWEDRGTGHVDYHVVTSPSGEKLEPIAGATNAEPIFAEPNSLVLTVKSEESGDLLLHQPVEKGIEYQRQGDTIIAWCEQTTALDLALSFQEIPRCIEIWQEIEAAATRMNHKLIHADQPDDLAGSDETRYADYTTDDNNSNFTLPAPELHNLAEIANKLSNAGPARKTYIVKELASDKYSFLRKLYHQLQVIEELEQYHECCHLFEIVKNIFALNEVSLLDWMTKSSRILDTIGCLEYDPQAAAKQSSDSRQPANTDHNATDDSTAITTPNSPTTSPPPTYTKQQTKHREFMRNSQFKVIVRFAENQVFYKIVQNYYLQYIRDVILSQYLDDQTLTSIGSMIFVNNVNIISRLAEDENYLLDLFSVLEKMAPINDAKPSDTTPAIIYINTSDNSTLTAHDNRPHQSTSSFMKSDSAITEPQESYHSGGEDNENMTPTSHNQVMKTVGQVIDVPTTDNDSDAAVSGDEHVDVNSDESTPVTKNPRKRPSTSQQTTVNGVKRLRRVKPVGVQVDVLRTYNVYDTRKQTFLYLQELVNLCKNMQPPLRDRFYLELTELDLLPTLHVALQASDPTNPLHMPIWLSCVDIVAQILAHDTDRVRQGIYHHTGLPTRNGTLQLFRRLLTVMITPKVDTGLMQQISYIIRTLLDTEMPSMDASDIGLMGGASTEDQTERDRFLTYVYKHVTPQFLAELQRRASDYLISPVRDSTAYTSIFFAVELVTFLAQSHTKFFAPAAVQYKLLTSITKLVQLPRIEMKCASIRFLRTVLATKDPRVVHEIVEHRLLDTVVDAFLANGARYNLLNSVVLELMSFIRTENISDLVAYLANHHLPRLQHIKYVDTFQQLQTRYEQNVEYENEPPTQSSQQEDNYNSNAIRSSNGHRKSELDIDDIDIQADEEQMNNNNHATDSDDVDDNESVGKHERSETSAQITAKDEEEFDQFLQSQQAKRRAAEAEEPAFSIRKSPLLEANNSPPRVVNSEAASKPQNGGLSIKLTGANSRRMSKSPNGSPTNSTSSPNARPPLSPPMSGVTQSAITGSPPRSLSPLSPSTRHLSAAANTHSGGSTLKTPPAARPTGLSPASLSPIFNTSLSPILSPLDSNTLDPDATDVLVNRKSLTNKRASPNIDVIDQAKRQRMLDAINHSNSNHHSNNSSGPSGSPPHNEHAQPNGVETATDDHER